MTPEQQNDSCEPRTLQDTEGIIHGWRRWAYGKEPSEESLAEKYSGRIVTMAPDITAELEVIQSLHPLDHNLTEDDRKRPNCEAPTTCLDGS